MGSSSMAQVEKEERAAGQVRVAQSSEEGEQQSPGVQRIGTGTLQSQHTRAQPGGDLVYQPSAKKENKRKSKVCLDRRCPELLPSHLKDGGPEAEPHPTLLERMVETLAVSQEQRKGTSRRNKPLYNRVRSLCAAEPTIPSAQLGSLGMRICRARPHWLQYFKI